MSGCTFFWTSQGQWSEFTNNCGAAGCTAPTEQGNFIGAIRFVPCNET